MEDRGTNSTYMNREQRRKAFKASFDFRRAGFTFQDANQYWRKQGRIQDPIIAYKDKSRMGAKRRGAY